MVGIWDFAKVDPAHVRVGVTQWDQFNNEVVGLTEALVREAIQNSTDAGNGTAPVKVRFQLKTLNAHEVVQLQEILSPLKLHFDVCGLNLSSVANQNSRILCIEDFNTVGLTGSFIKSGEGNFDAFWRAVGESAKSGQKGGRWGLGKLVYPFASKTRSFFGMTVREGDACPSIMGQVVLRNHSISNEHFPSHGFWSSGRSGSAEKLHQPITDADEIQKFKLLFGLKRLKQCGLSVMIPHLVEEFTEEEILWNIVKNYCFPILAGRLEAAVGEVIVNSETLKDVAKNIENKQIDVPIPFLIEVSELLGADTALSPNSPLVDDGFTPDHFSVEKISEMKKQFSSGELVHVRAPVVFRPKTGGQETGDVEVFLKSVPENEAPFSLFARGAITLPGESNFAGAALGVVVATEGCAAKFLGDAENPSHTRWSARSKKLNENWIRPLDALRAIRRSLRSLYEIVGEQREDLHEDDLIQFFSLAHKAQKLERKKVRVIKPEPDIPQGEPAIRIRPSVGGFSLRAGPGAKDWKFPQIIRMRVAYDTVGGNPFNRFSIFDFDLRKWSSQMFEAISGTVHTRRANTLFFKVDGPDFSLSVNGFDIRRDIIVEARVVS